MAGDWLKIEANTPEKPEVLAIAAELDIEPDLAFAKCFRIWRWFDNHTRSGNAHSVTKVTLDKLLGVPNFCSAMEKVGWLVVENGFVSIPHFDRHNSKSAKERALTSKRVAEFKRKNNARGNGEVTVDALPREEKRRVITGPDRKPDRSDSDGRTADEVRRCVIESMPVLSEAAELAVEPLPTRKLSGGAFAALKEIHLSDTRSLSEWFKRQLSLPDPVCGHTRADLILVLAAGLFASRMPASDVKKSRVAVFVNVVNRGRWRQVTRHVEEANQNLLELECNGHSNQQATPA